jgi:hypothetical protein
VPDAVVEPEDRSRQQPRVVLRDRPLLHGARQEAGPRELEVARTRPRRLPRLLLARGSAAGRQQALLGDQHAVALDVALGEPEAVVHDRDEALQRLAAVRGELLEARAEALDRLVHDHVQAVLLGLEVVIQRGRPDADVGRDVGPSRVLVAVPAEALRGRGDDLVPLRAS